MPRPSSPQGSVSLDGDTLFVRFRFSEVRFKAIKLIRGARFDKERKHWRLPLHSLPELARMDEFSPEHMHYQFDMEPVAQKLHERARALLAARERFTASPFSVASEDIELLRPEIVFRLNEFGALRAELAPSSSAKRHLEALPGVHYIRREKLYFLSPAQLPDFLKVLRDKRVSFAVERDTSERLKLGTTTRSRLSGEPSSGSPEELYQALLFPFLALHPTLPLTLQFIGWTTEQLKDCLPKEESFVIRKTKSQRLSMLDAARLLYQADAMGHRAWVTSGAQQALKAFAESSEQHGASKGTSCGIEDSILALNPPPACWITTIDGRGAFLIAHALFDTHLEKRRDLWADSVLAKSSQFPNHHLLPWRGSLLRRAFERLQEIPELRTTPQSASYRAHLLELSSREMHLRRSAEFHSMTDASPMLHNQELEQKLFPHQRIAVKWLLESRQGILGDDMGLGKTLSILCALQELKTRREVTRALIICPNSLVRNWLREAAQWTKDLRLHALPQGKRAREEYMLELESHGQYDGIIVNFETARLDYVYPTLQRLFSSQGNLLCIDESQRIKNPQSKAFEVIRDLSKSFGRRFLLTGTPTPRDLSDIWGQMMIVDQGERLGKNFYDWLTSVAELGNKYSEMAVRRYLPEQVEETILRVHEVLLRRRKEEVVNLPPKTFSTRDIELTSSQEKRYDEVRNELLLRMRTIDGKDYVRSIDSILEQYLRAVQIASNPRLVDPTWVGDPAKFLELDQIVNEIVEERGGKLVIWTNYLGNVDELTARYSKLGVAPFSGKVSPAKRQASIQEFQETESKLKILVAVPAAGGVGITLTAAQTAVYVEKTWNAEHWMQSVDRIHRIGQTGLVNIISLHACKVDELIAFNLRRKELNQARLLRGVEIDPSSLYPTREELLQALT